MSALLEKISDLNNLILHGKGMDAFEKYYHDDVIMQESGNQPIIGKEANRRRGLEFFSNVMELSEACVIKVAAGEGFTMVQWSYNYTHKEFVIRNYIQVSIQEWNDGKIIKERFFYGN